MREPRQRPSLLQQGLSPLPAGVRDLDRHLAVEQGVAREQNLPEATLAQAANHVVATEVHEPPKRLFTRSRKVFSSSNS